MKPLFSTLLLIVMSTSMYGQAWLDKELYPFKQHQVKLEAGTMSYLDEGKGEILLFVHGTPTWSFLYRDFVKDLSKDYRCIAIDHIGFGLSEKPTDFSGTPQDHAKNLSEFIKELNLENVTLVVHDFGGPIGIGAALKNSKRIKNVVVFNTWLWATEGDPFAMEIDKIVNSKEGEAAYIEMNYSPTVLLKQAFSNPDNLSEKEHNHYIQPFADKQSRYALLNIGKAFVGSSDWYQKQWDNLDKLEDKNWLFIWGTKDPFLNTGYLTKWTTRFPAATVIKYDCGHFVQEENTKEAIAAIRGFMKS